MSTKEKAMVGGCCVCADDEGTAYNPLVYCDGKGCTVAVHKGCYGIESIPDGAWFCRKCESKEDGSYIKCELCPIQKGAFKRTVSQGWCHVLCALFIPEAAFINAATMEPISLDKIPASRKGKVCCVCEKGRPDAATYGACITCNQAGCKVAFHVTCGHIEGLLVEEGGTRNKTIYLGYCHRHLEKVKSRGQALRPIPAFCHPKVDDASASDTSPDKKELSTRQEEDPPTLAAEPTDLGNGTSRRGSVSSAVLSVDNKVFPPKGASLKDVDSSVKGLPEDEANGSGPPILQVEEPATAGRPSLSNGNVSISGSLGFSGAGSVHSGSTSAQATIARGKKTPAGGTKRGRKKAEPGAPKAVRRPRGSGAARKSSNLTGSNSNPFVNTLLPGMSQPVEVGSMPTYNAGLVPPQRPTPLSQLDLSGPNQNSGEPGRQMSMEELLEWQWDEAGGFFMQQGENTDIVSLLTCLHQLKQENDTLEVKATRLARRKDHLLYVNAQLARAVGAVDVQTSTQAETPVADQTRVLQQQNQPKQETVETPIPSAGPSQSATAAKGIASGQPLVATSQVTAGQLSQVQRQNGLKNLVHHAASSSTTGLMQTSTIPPVQSNSPVAATAFLQLRSSVPPAPVQPGCVFSISQSTSATSQTTDAVGESKHVT